MPPRDRTRSDRPRSAGRAPAAPRRTAARADAPARAVPFGRIELAAAALASLGLVALHGVFLRHAGGLWRDEANSVAMATMPTLGAIRALLGADSFPLFYTLVLRVWCAGPWGAGDTVVRALGLVVGLGTLAALWWSARVLGARTPWVALGLFGFNAVAIRAVDTVRPYGLATLLLVLAFALVWRVVEDPRPRRVALATLVAVLVVQTLYPATLLLLGIGLAGIAVALRAGRPRAALGIVIAGAVAALSLAPYAPALKAARAWAPLVQFEYGFAAIWRSLSEALNGGAPGFVTVWIGLAIVAIAVAAALALRVPRRAAATPATERAAAAALYSALTLAVSITAFLLFLRSTKFITEPWYYMPAMGVAAAALDGALGAIVAPAGRGAGASARALVPVGVLALVVGLAWPAMAPALRVRQTNVDLVARAVAQGAGKDDFVVVYPWFIGVSYARYAHAAAAWQTVPPLADHRIHRYDQYAERMRTPDALHDLLAAIQHTLSTGHRVWLVGGLGLPAAGMAAETPPALAATTPLSGARNMSYLQAWAEQAGVFVKTHATNSSAVEIPEADPVSELERVPLFVVSGWTPEAH